MDFSNDRLMHVEAEVRAPVATAQLVRFHFPERIEKVMREAQSYRLDLCLTPRPTNARACYPDRWGTHRFEPIGNLFLVPPGESMLAISDGCCQQASILCQLHPEPMRDWFDGALEWTDQGLSAGLDIRDRNIRSLLMRLAEEARNPGFASEMMVELIAAQVAIELARYCNDSNEKPATGGLAPWRLRRIDERLREESAPPTLVELAALCRVSVRQLTRGFRESRACSIGDYIANHRVEQAKRRLATDESVKAIAYSLGFSSPSSFSFAFRRVTGETPGDFRQRLLVTH
ncbi:MAG: helix-turn-helix transcriptional regulator [Halioglobus sp.]|nr:helix-turn-helix transcriptional regulator [Halioglobus sp.]